MKDIHKLIAFRPGDCLYEVRTSQVKSLVDVAKKEIIEIHLSSIGGELFICYTLEISSTRRLSVWSNTINKEYSTNHETQTLTYSYFSSYKRALEFVGRHIKEGESA